MATAPEIPGHTPTFCCAAEGAEERTRVQTRSVLQMGMPQMPMI